LRGPVDSFSTSRSDEPRSDYLFTYGTLQPGRAPAEIANVVEQLPLLGRGYVYGTLFDFGHYPGAVLDVSSTTRVPGAIYKLPPDQTLLAQLDDYEEYSPESPETSQFIRELHPVHCEDGRTVSCWVYVYNERFLDRFPRS
jgi:gamma-glutamylcyclotransferase (GGCT)/AIG2-like uncharacterized protein YtfP